MNHFDYDYELIIKKYLKQEEEITNDAKEKIESMFEDFAVEKK